MRYVVWMVKRRGTDEHFEIFVFAGEADLSVPAGRYSPKLRKVVNTEEVSDDFAMIITLTEASPLWHRAVRAFKDYTILHQEAQSA